MTFKPAVLGVLSLAALLSATSLLEAAPRLVLSTSAIGTIQVKAGSNGPSQVVQAYNAGSGTLNLSATSSASWLAATVGSLASCSVNPGGCYPINISLNTASLALGTYTEYLTVADPNAVDSPQQIAVTIAVGGVPNSLSFYVTPVGGPTTSAEIGIYPAGTGAKGAVSTQSGGNWLVFTPNNGGIVVGAPFTINVAAQINQGPGVYTGSVTISGSSVSSDNKTIPVTLTVTTSPIVEINGYSTLLVSGPAGAKTGGSVSFTNAGEGTLNITSATATSTSGNFLSVASASGNTVNVTADATSLTPGIYYGAVTIASNAANNAQVSVPVEFTVTAATPLISSGAVVNVGNYFQEAVAPGDIAAVFGSQFAPAGSAFSNSGTPLPTSLGGVQVLVNNVPAPLYYVSPGQINFQMPYEAPVGQVSTVQVVNNGVAGNIRSINVLTGSPRIILLPSNIIAGGYGAIINTDGSITLPASDPVPGRVVHAAKAGDTVVIYCVGFGQTSPAATDGAAANFAPALQLNPTATVTFGGGFYGSPTTVTAAYTGLTPGSVGLYQVNATLPPDVPLGNMIPVTININGAISNYAFMAVSH
jgi:adhesin/invasin